MSATTVQRGKENKKLSASGLLYKLVSLIWLRVLFNYEMNESQNTMMKLACNVSCVLTETSSSTVPFSKSSRNWLPCSITPSSVSVCKSSLMRSCYFLPHTIKIKYLNKQLINTNYAYHGLLEFAATAGPCYRTLSPSKAKPNLNELPAEVFNLKSSGRMSADSARRHQETTRQSTFSFPATSNSLRGSLTFRYVMHPVCRGPRATLSSTAPPPLPSPPPPNVCLPYRAVCCRSICRFKQKREIRPEGHKHQGNRRKLGTE